MAADTKIRVGLIGVGTWAEFGHIPALRLLPQYEITAVSSRDSQKARQIADRHGIQHAFGSARELAEHADVDLVVVLNPAPHHEVGIRAAIAAKKDVYSEWPLTPTKDVSAELMNLANQNGVRHLVGLQRRLAPEYRYIADLIDEGYIGKLRSMRLHISVEYFKKARTAGLYYTVPEENFSSLLAIYGGHYFDAMFEMLGYPKELNALTVQQFDKITLIETGEVLPHSTADQVIVSGKFESEAVFTVHIEAGKNNNYGIQLDLTGTSGDIKLTNTTSFGNALSVIEAAQGEGQKLERLVVPAKYNWLPANELGASTAELANLYVAYGKDVADGTHIAPTFADGLAMHELIEKIEQADKTGTRVTLK